MSDTKSEKSDYAGNAGPERSENVANKENRKGVLDVDDANTQQLNAVFENPLANIPKETLLTNVEDFCRENDLVEHIELMKRGALAAQNPHGIHDISELTQEDVAILEHERTHKWDQPWQLYWLVCRS